MKTRESERAAIQANPIVDRRNNDLRNHWQTVAVDYFNMTGELATARKHWESLAQVPSPRGQAIPPEWRPDSRTDRNPLQPADAFVEPKVLNPDPLRH